MKTFKVTYEELLSKTIIIKAENENEAYSKALSKYRNEEIVLDADDFIGETDIYVDEVSFGY